MMEQAVVKLTTRERELRKRIEDILDPAAAARARLAAATAAANTAASTATANSARNSTYVPLDATLKDVAAHNHINGARAQTEVNENGKGSKKRKPNGEGGPKKGKKRKAGE